MMQKCMLEDGDPLATLAEMNGIYQQRVIKKQSIVTV